MPKVGLKDFPYTEEGVAQAESYSEATGIPISNAMDRSVQTYIHGGRVGQQGIAQAPQMSPSAPRSPMFNKGVEVAPQVTPPRLYKKGGKVNGKYKK